jgi:hypothetical protein
LKKTRAEREKELQRLAETDDGKWALTDMARLYLGIPDGEAIPRTALLIYVILSNEYPPG